MEFVPSKQKIIHTSVEMHSIEQKMGSYCDSIKVDYM